MITLTVESWLQKAVAGGERSIDLTLARVRQVASAMQLTTFACPVVHVAGTNGKGTCVHGLAECLSAGRLSSWGFYLAPFVVD